jgi:putative DNA primase/helicase
MSNHTSIQREIEKTSLYQTHTATELKKLPRAKWRVPNIIPESGICTIFGPSASGKSFVSLGLAAAVANGSEWFGYETSPCRVMYVVLENQGGIMQRIEAWEKHHGQDFPNDVIFMLEGFKLNQKADLQRLLRTIKSNGPYGIVVIDTLHQAAHDFDENSAQAMGGLIDAAKAISDTTNGLIVLVHHTGKNESRGPRGSSSFFAALDCAIELKCNGEDRSWILGKSKDSEGGVSHSFRLHKVDLTEESGEPASSCIVQPVGQQNISSASSKPRSRNQTVVLDKIRHMLVLSANKVHGGADSNTPCVGVKELIDAVRNQIDAPEDRRNERVKDALKSLLKNGLIQLTSDWIWIEPAKDVLNA